MKPRDPPDQVRHAIRVYARGIIYPSEMWHLLAAALTPENVTLILDGLPEETKNELVNVYIDRPPIVYSIEQDYQPVSVPIVQWCEAACAQRGLSTTAAASHGMRCVKVEHGMVVERLDLQ